MVIGVPKEIEQGEQRVSLSPEVVTQLVKKGFAVIVEQDAGARAFYTDASYQGAGATITNAEATLQADLVTKVQPPTLSEIAQMKEGAALVSFLRPLDDLETVRALDKQGVTSFAMELVPRTTRAQKLDALSAMSSISGYKAVLLAADMLPKFFPLLTTAAGTIRPAKVLVLGAGVAGLQALATARRLGAVTSAYDVRAAAAEEAKSLGAKFIELDLDTQDAATQSGYATALSEDRAERQIQLLAQHIAEYDVVIATALIPGRKAPILISEEAVQNMQAGSVIIDLAAANGGNCPLTEADKTVVKHGVSIVGATNLPASMPLHASQLYARTVLAALGEIVKDGALNMNFEDEIIRGFCVTHKGEVVHDRVRQML
jgi:NAD(P) transhydrogenase subunit alpha